MSRFRDEGSPLSLNGRRGARANDDMYSCVFEFPAAPGGGVPYHNRTLGFGSLFSNLETFNIVVSVLLLPEVLLIRIHTALNIYFLGASNSL